MNKKTKSVKKRSKLNQKAWEKLNKVVNEPSEPTAALKTLMKNS
mgnify:CR=1 FL=1